MGGLGLGLDVDFISTSFEAEMNQAEIQALIDAHTLDQSLTFWGPRSLNWQSLPQQGVRSTGSSQTLYSGKININTGTGANKMWEARENIALDPTETTTNGEGWW